MITLTQCQTAVRSLYKNRLGEPFELTLGQAEIFRSIYEPSFTRVTVKATTQYGKSDTASMALILAAVERREKILIVAPSSKQAGIIMGLVITHLFDNAIFPKAIEFSGSLERLKEERSKKRITFRNGSEIFILTANAREVKQNANSLMGFGATIVVVDESSLLPDSMFSRILRMVGGVKNGKLVQLGNPFEKNHFGRAFDSKRYYKISIGYKQALKEGRLSQEFLDEAREEMSQLEFQIFYECEFPKQGAVDALIPLDWIELAVNQDGCEGEHKQGGLDVARFGGDRTVYIGRRGGLVHRIEEVESMDTMEVVGWSRKFMTEDEPEVVGVDVIGIGAGVCDRLYELSEDGEVDCEIEEVNVGESPTSDETKKKFMNLRAENYWHLRNMFKPDKNGKSQISIPDDVDLKKELKEIRYKFSSERKIKIEPKDEMKKRLGRSPDKADALMLAFCDLKAGQPDMYIPS